MINQYFLVHIVSSYKHKNVGNYSWETLGNKFLAENFCRENLSVNFWW
jgi:hypothetical protein